MTEISGNTYLTLNGKRTFFLGVNYWSREGNILMWRRWNIDNIRDDMEKLRDAGLNSIRAFILAEDFALPDGTVKREYLDRLRLFLDEANRYGINVFLTLLVGHMSGKNWPFPWDPDNKIYTVEALERTRRFITTIVRNFKDHPAIAGWILTNEITNVRVPPGNVEFELWLRDLVNTVKSVDGRRVISLGDGTVPYKPAVRPEIVGKYVDFLSPHIYLYDNNPVRHTLTYMAIIEYCLSLGKPTLLEEFGFPTNLFTEETHAGFIEVVLVGSLALGASGAFIWCGFDFPGEEDQPYLWEPHELAFGIYRSDGSPKKAVEAIKRFRELLDILDLRSYTLPNREAKIVVPATLYGDLPFTFENRWDLFKALAQSYTLAKMASLNVTFTREEDVSRGKLFIVPSVPRLQTRTWRILLRYVEEGATLYYSHARYLNHPHVSSCHIWEELFGVKPDLKAGMRGKVCETLEIGLRGYNIKIPVARNDVGTTGFAEVDASPKCRIGEEKIMFEAKRGEGRVILLSYPIELYLSSSVSELNAYRLYEYLADISGIKVVYKPGRPVVQVEYWLKRDQPKILFLINHSYEYVETTLYGEKIWGRSEVRGNKVLLSPKSASVFEI